MEQKDVVGTEEAAKELGKSRRTLQRWISLDYDLPCRKVGNAWGWDIVKLKLWWAENRANERLRKTAR